jgi:hypothetical protein
MGRSAAFHKGFWQQQNPYFHTEGFFGFISKAELAERIHNAAKALNTSGNFLLKDLPCRENRAALPWLVFTAIAR